MAHTSAPLNEFIAHTFGLQGIQIIQNEPFALTLENDVTLMIEHTAVSTKLTVLKKIEAHALNDIAIMLLQLCHFDNGLPFTLQAGYLTDNLLTVSVYLSEHTLTLPTLNQCFDNALNTLTRAQSQTHHNGPTAAPIPANNTLARPIIEGILP